MRVLVLHGPNLNLLGERESHHYGLDTLAEIDARLVGKAEEGGVELESFQSNCEGELITRLQEAAFGGGARGSDGVLINPGAYAHTSLAMADAIEEVVRRGVPVVEVHLSNVHGREPLRRQLVTARSASGVVSGLGPLSYELGLEAVIALARQETR